MSAFPWREARTMADIMAEEAAQRAQPTPRPQRAALRVDPATAIKARNRARDYCSLAVEEFLAADPEPSGEAPPAEDWTDAAILGTFELGDISDDYNDEYDDVDQVGGIVARAALGGAQPDYSRYLEALRAKPLPVNPAPARALPLAPGRDGCHACGIPGYKGCDHQAPCAPVELPAEPEGSFKRRRGVYK